MNDQAFLSDILAHPADETLRLVFADWLEDNGDPDRAEFIRVECQREKVPDFDPERDRLDRRARELRAANEERWFGPFQTLTEDFGTKRGFVESITMKASRFVKNADAILALAPVRELILLAAKSQGRTLAACPQLARLARLAFEDNEMGPAACRGLAASPHLTNLRELDLGGCTVGTSGFKALMSSRSFPRLELLDLSGNSVSNAIYTYLRRASFPALKTLHLAGNDVRDACLGGLAWANSFDALEELSLDFNHLTVAGVRELARWPTLKNLRILNLQNNPLGDEGVEALALAPLDSIRKLIVGSVGAGVVGARALAAAPLRHLTDLWLWHSRLGVQGASVLADAPWLAGLVTLHLDDCSIGPEGLSYLLGADHPPRLHTLSLSGNQLDDDCVVELALSSVLSGVVSLDLSKNPLTPRSASSLAASDCWRRIRWLSLPGSIGNLRQREELKERFSQAQVFFQMQ